MIDLVTFHRFKQFRETTFELRPGVSLVAGSNNSGKSTLLHGLAIWEFCRTVLQNEKGTDTFLQGGAGQGLGLGDDEFSPINVPSLKHLWTNLKTQKESEPDGYTLNIGVQWGEGQRLRFGLSLSNDRLFVKATDSTLDKSSLDTVPRLAYLPPFAGMTDKEGRVAGAIRRRRIGEGLAGAVLRNILLDLYEANDVARKKLRADRSKIRDADLRALRENDPWELLQQTLRQTFGAELSVSPFREEYHSYIRVDVVKGVPDGYRLNRHPGYNARDLMVEGSGFLQWLSVYALATSPSIDVLLLDEPDAHLHPSLQDQLFSNLDRLAMATDKQVLIATHSTEILKHASPQVIMEMRSGKPGRYLAEESQKVGLLSGLGSDYAPKIDRVKRSGRLLFIEGASDENILRVVAEKLGLDFPGKWVVWRTSAGHKERKQVFIALKEEVPALVAVSLRDRDDEAKASVDSDLVDKTHQESVVGLRYRKWRRRHIESYLLWPPAIARAAGLDEEDVHDSLRDRFSLAVGDNFFESDVPDALMDAGGKEILAASADAILGQLPVTPVDVAEALTPEEVCVDLRTFLQELDELA